MNNHFGGGCELLSRESRAWLVDTRPSNVRSLKYGDSMISKSQAETEVSRHFEQLYPEAVTVRWDCRTSCDPC